MAVPEVVERIAFDPITLTSQEEARRYAWSLVLADLSTYERTLLEFDPIHYQDEQGRPVPWASLTREQRILAGGDKCLTEDNVVYEAGACRYLGPKITRHFPAWKEIQKAVDILAKMGVAEAAKTLKEEAKKSKSESPEETFERLKREAAKYDLKLVPK